MTNQPNLELKVARRVLALSALLAVVAGIAEVWVRYDDLSRYGTPFWHSPSFGSDLTVHDSLGVRGRPNGVHKKWRLNSAGFRSPESALLSPANCSTVAVIGASETFGFEERAGGEYPAQLADSLSTRGCFRVLNAGLTGASLEASRQYWNLWVSRFAPKIVVVYLNPLQYLGEAPPTAPKLLPTASATSAPIRPRLLDRAKDLIVYPEFVQRRRLVRMVESLEKGRDTSWFLPRVPRDRLRSFVAAVDTVVSDIERRGARPILVFHAMRDTSLTSERALFGFESLRQFGARARRETFVAFDSAAQPEVSALATRRGVTLINLRPTLSGHGENFVDAVHFTELGAARVAHYLADETARAERNRLVLQQRP